MNIGGSAKRPWGFGGLIIVFIAIGVIGIFITSRGDSRNAQKAIDNIALLQSGSSYVLKDGKFVVRYGDGATGVVPLDPGTEAPVSFFSDKAVYLSSEVTAIACGGTETEKTVQVLVSGDKGRTWSSSRVAEAGVDHAETKFIGFTSKKDGWLVTAGDVASGYQKNRVFLTEDGGKSWAETGNTSEVYPHVVTGAGFADEKTGFLSFRYDIDPNPILYRTQDRGKTWEKCTVELPSQLKNSNSYPTALSPVFNGPKGILPVTLTDNETGLNTHIRYITGDYGRTWTFDKKNKRNGRTIQENGT